MKKSRSRALVPSLLALLTLAAAASPGVVAQDQQWAYIFRVPVQVSNLLPEVSQVFALCKLRYRFSTAGGRASNYLRWLESESWRVDVSGTGSWSGTLEVRFPRAAFGDLTNALAVHRAVCDLRLVGPGGQVARPASPDDPDAPPWARAADAESYPVLPVDAHPWADR